MNVRGICWDAKVGLLLVMAVGMGWSQTEPAAERSSVQEVAAAELPYTEPLTPPSFLTGDRPSLTFTSEVEANNLISGGLQFAGTYDDNVFPIGSSRQSDLSYLVAPSLELRRSTARWQSRMAFYPGFTVQQKYGERNQSAYNLDFDTTLQASPHVAVRVRDYFDRATSLFAGLLDNSLSPGFDPARVGNQVGITPLATHTGNNSAADVNYRFGKNSVMGVGATYYFENYGDAGASSPALVDTRSFSAGSFYAHQLDNQQWAGASYNFQRLNFEPGSRTTVQRFLLFYAVPVAQQVTLSLWGGPQYTTSGFSGGTAASVASPWSGAGGVSLAWQGQRTSLSAEFNREISDGGGLAQAVTLQQVNAEVRRRLSQRWTMNLGMSYGDSDPLLSQAGSGYGRVRTLSVMAGLERVVNNHLRILMQYGRDRQEYDKAVRVLPNTNRNRAWATVSYTFTRPLGR